MAADTVYEVNEALAEYFSWVERDGHEQQVKAVDVAGGLAFAPVVVDVADGDHVPLARLEFELVKLKK